MKRDTHDDVIGGRVGSGTGDLEGTLFGGGAPAATKTPTMQDVIIALVTLAMNRKDYGICADDLLRIMRDKGIAWRVGRGEQRRFSNTGMVLKHLANEGILVQLRYPDGAPVTRKSERKDAHSNRQCVYVHKNFAGQARGAA